jgi:hypothetical protein
MSASPATAPPPLVLMSAVAILCACASVRPITARPLIDGRPAKAIAVVLNSSFSVKHFFSTYTLPAGRYEPTLEDEDGAYFAAPAKIVGSALAASFLYDGGLYFRTDGSKRIDAYVIVRNQPLFVVLPRDFQYAVEQRPTVGERTAKNPAREKTP